MIASIRFLAEVFWPALAAAGATGIVVGAATCSTKPMRTGGRAVVLLSVALLALAGAASFMAWVPRRPGLWLDIAVLGAAAYVIGCVAGCLLRKAFTRAPSVSSTRPGLSSP